MTHLIRVLALLASLLGLSAHAAESTGTQTSATFTTTTAEIANPERGFVQVAGNLESVTAGNLSTWRSAGYRLVIHKTSLAPYVATPTLPGSYITNLTTAAGYYRAAGMKMVLRFVYSTSTGQAEPTLAVAQGHVNQLSTFLKANADVIAFVQAGFMGVNGLWQETSSATMGAGSVSAASRDAMRTSLFAAIDKRTMIEFPLPLDMRRWYPPPLPRTLAFSGSDQARSGFHNDAFLSSGNDGNTYLDPATGLVSETLSNPLRAYTALALQSGLPMGLEPTGSGRTTCADILEEGPTYFATHMVENATYTTAWASCLAQVKRSVGYRFELRSVAHQSTVNPGDNITINLQVRNVGWAKPFTQRRVMATLVGSAATVTCTSSSDLRGAPPQATNNYSVPIRCVIPFGTPTGSYTLYLSAPDPWPALKTNQYAAIQWANANATGQTWDATNFRIGTNTTVTVGTPPASGGGQAPEPGSLTGLTNVTSRITATSGMVIEGKNITTTSGPCIVLPAGVQNVTIRGNVIGPCGVPTTVNGVNGGGEGILMQVGAGGGLGITVQRNIFRDVSTAMYAQASPTASALNPVVFDRNYIYNIRGPFWQGQAIQWAIRDGNGQSKITCNVIDGDYKPGYAGGQQDIEDHISFYEARGVSASLPIEVAYNRIIGVSPAVNPSKSGSGMQMGDGPNGQATKDTGFYWIHHNTIVGVPGIGLGIAGGHDIRVEDNRVDQRAAGIDTVAVLTQQSRPYTLANHSANRACGPIQMNRNRSTYSRVWAFDNGWFCPKGPNWPTGAGNPDGTPHTEYGACTQAWAPTDSVYNAGCTVSEFNGNNFNDPGLNAMTRRQIFEQKYSECDSGTGTGGGTGGGVTFGKTQIYPLAEAPRGLYAGDTVLGEVRQGQDMELKVRVFGVPITNSSGGAQVSSGKGSVHLVRAADNVCDTTLDANNNARCTGTNHFDVFPTNADTSQQGVSFPAWNGFGQYSYKVNVSASLPTGDYKVVIDFYSATGPNYYNFFAETDCGPGATQLDTGTTHGCIVGTLKVTAASGVSPSTVYTSLSGSAKQPIARTPWGGP